MTIEQLVEEAKQVTHEREINITVSFIEKMVELFSKIQEVQPTIEKVGFGMGAWYFYGHAVGKYTDDGEEAIIDDDSFAHYIKEGGENYVVEVPINEACFEFVKLADHFVDYSGDGLNASTLIDGISSEGVIFEREVEPKSFFGHPPLSSLLSSYLFKRIKERNIKVKIVEL